MDYQELQISDGSVTPRNSHYPGCPCPQCKPKTLSRNHSINRFSSNHKEKSPTETLEQARERIKQLTQQGKYQDDNFSLRSSVTTRASEVASPKGFTLPLKRKNLDIIDERSEIQDYDFSHRLSKQRQQPQVHKSMNNVQEALSQKYGSSYVEDVNNYWRNHYKSKYQSKLSQVLSSQASVTSGKHSQRISSPHQSESNRKSMDSSRSVPQIIVLQQPSAQPQPTMMMPPPQSQYLQQSQLYPQGFPHPQYGMHNLYSSFQSPFGNPYQPQVPPAMANPYMMPSFSTGNLLMPTPPASIFL